MSGKNDNKDKEIIKKEIKSIVSGSNSIAVNAIASAMQSRNIAIENLLSNRNQITQLNSSIENILTQINSPMLKISSQMSQFAESLKPIQQLNFPAISLAISPIVFDQIKVLQNSFIPLFDNLKNSKILEYSKEIKTKKYRSFMKEWGWLVYKKSITLGDWCYALYKKYGNSTLNNKLNRHFYHKSNLNIVYNDLKESGVSKFRLEIINEAFEYHYKKNYNISIPLMLTQVDGLVWELGVLRKKVSKGYNSKKKIGKKGDWSLAELSKELFPKDEFHKKLVVEIFKDGFRNKVMHGRNIHNNKQKEISRQRSTLLILSLWRLADEFDEVKLKT